MAEKDKRADGDARSEQAEGAPTPGGLPQEDVEDRDNVGIVKPGDYPSDQCASAETAAKRAGRRRRVRSRTGAIRGGCDGDLRSMRQRL